MREGPGTGTRSRKGRVVRRKDEDFLMEIPGGCISVDSTFLI